MSKLYFLEPEDVIEIHEDILAQEPGLHGVHHDKVDAVVGRIKNISIYGNDCNTAVELAAHYCVALARGHAFNDANKRTAFVCMMTVLDVNDFSTPDQFTAELIGNNTWADIMVTVAEGLIQANELSKIIAISIMLVGSGLSLTQLASILAEQKLI
ncbi:type II toxin-antitoxin system death-on-curing family toxin [Vibrio pectenicida]|uniref:Type II toxin-antitoxin system death-on-curing family toxin n=1 Tax=Vibrio pectenicida TaxID=62763 RepID=A0A427U2N2_9VIBR|nr:type II toxin-antitoxin system death-on-curing family toxin [Vibrio pectenicida]RSD30930.1 type II toxin-antitoxin system death-on-curing family toxin [Vibrio pectenicida]